MAITRIKNSTISNKTPKYNDVLAGLPFRPIIGTATDGGNGTSASVAFTGNNPAGAGITYTALSSPGSFTGTGTVSPITVSGLTAGTAYTFQVKAGNSLGDSAYSAASNSVTPVTPTSYESIASATGTGSSGTITFSSIPSTYTSLQIRFVAKDTFVADNGGQAYIQFNSDTTSSYNSHRIYGDGAAVTASSQSGPSATATYSAPLSIARSGAAVNTNTISVGIIDIHDYANTSRNKTLRWFNGFDNNNTDGVVALASGLWRSTSAITSISIFSPNTAWTTNTTFALYGIKGE